MKELAYIAGGVCGGIAGYLLVELVVDWAVWEEGAEKEEAVVLPDDETAIALDTTKLPLSALVRGYISEETNLVDEPDDPDEQPIRIVSTTYAENSPFKKVECYYYNLDGVFVTNTDDVITEPRRIFGPNIHLHFGEEADDINKVFVENREDETIYSIFRLNAAYKDVKEDTRPKTKRNNRRRKAAKPDLSDLTGQIYEDDGGI